ncbi:four helix bundle protein [bacterium]|nr:four helix bundle protein [bacterium]
MGKRFEDLRVWQLGRNFRRVIYKISKKVPKEEMYCLTQQIRRAAISITSNIAEGWGRYHYQENIQFCRISRGSINEVLDHLYTAQDENYISKKEFEQLYEQGREVEKVLNGYLGYLQRQLSKKN